MLPRDVLTFATVMMTSLAVAAAAAAANKNRAPADPDPEDYEVFADDEEKSTDNDSSNVHEVRCYCNQPECVPQGYMCRGRGCFTELPSNANAPLLRAEQSASSGCLDERYKNRPCPTGYLCCDQDLCNHVDNPAMRSRLNKTLQVLAGDQRAYLGPLQPNSHTKNQTTDWFKTAMIAVPICGFFILLIIASLAVRLLHQPPVRPVHLPAPIRPGCKLAPHRTSVNEPPLLGPPKVPLV